MITIYGNFILHYDLHFIIFYRLLYPFECLTLYFIHLFQQHECLYIEYSINQQSNTKVQTIIEV